MFNNKYMEQAILVAKKSSDEVPVGAIIVDPSCDKIIAQASNMVECNQDPTAHAEIVAIRSACLNLSNKYLYDLDLYVTLQPCPMCLQAAIYARIRRIYFGAYTTNIIEPNHNIEIYGGICEDKCKNLLDSFFASKR